MDDEKMADLSNNPFAALFQDVDSARKFAEGTSLALGHIQSSQSIEINSDEGEENDEDANGATEMEQGEFHLSSTSAPNFNKDFVISDLLQRIFLITVDFDEINHGVHQFGGLPYHSIKLNELREECEDNSNSSYHLSLQNINQALYERLQIPDPTTLLLTRSGYSGNTKLECCETRLIKYLSGCYCRIKQEEDSMKNIFSSMSGKSVIDLNKTFEEELHKVANDCRKLVVSFTGTVLLQSEIFPAISKQPHRQLLDVLISAYNEHHLYEYAHKLIESHTDKEDLSKMFMPVLDHMWKISEKFTILHPDVFPLLNILLLFSQSSLLTWCLLKSKYWLPVAQHGGQYIGSAFEYETILGRFLRITSIPLSGAPSELYLKPSSQSESDMNAITNSIRQYLDILVTMLHKFLHNLFQLPDMQHNVLLWIGLCLNANIKRSQMYTDPTIVAGSGFFLNLTQVLLKFCEPFCLPNSKLLFKVDCRYGAIISTTESVTKLTTPIHSIGLDKYTPMVPKPEEMAAVKISETKFNFISELFFLTHLCYKLGFVKMYEQYEELMKRLRKLSNVYQDAQRQGNIAGVIENFRTDFENGMRTQLAVKAHLLTPSLADLALKFSTSSGYWLVQQVLAADEYVISKHRDLDAHALSTEIPPALTIIPEFVAENVGDTVKSIGNFNEESLERCEHLTYLMNFFGVFLGAKNRMKNPHLRAKLAECLAAFLPKDKTGLSRTNHFSFSYRQKAFELSPVLVKILPQSLLQLFVDIEFTGHTMEFDQKFMYRRYMYSVLEYIWEIPAYLSVFKDLYKHGKLMYNKEKVLSTFPRFINLLVNDSTFLLDEALQHLVTIKELEHEKASGEWNELSDQEKQEKQRNLTQCGHMAEGYNTMAKETVQVICYITKEIDRPFVSHIMADSMAAFLNYFFVHLVGPKRKLLKVNDFEKYNFDPGDLVKNITKIYLHLGKHDDFCQAIAKDSRSYTPELFNSAVEVLERLEGAHGMALELRNLSVTLQQWSVKLLKAAEEMPEPPEEFVDPISCELMQEPVELPSSGKIVCRSTIAKHLLSDEKDPFNRSPLRLDQVIPCPELQEKICQWMKDNCVDSPLYLSD